MAFGFPPKHHQAFSIEDGQAPVLLSQAVEAAEILGWEISFISESGFIAHTKFSMASWSEQVDLTIRENEVTIVSICTGNQLFDWGKNRKNVRDFIHQLKMVREQFSPEYLSEKLEIARTLFSAGEFDLPEPGKPKNSVSSFFALFFPTQEPYVTPTLITLNALVFSIMTLLGVGLFDPDIQSLLDWGANYRPSTLRGEWWRLLTACFIHIGLVHLLLNLYALLYIGILLEPYLKKSRFFVVYITTGIIASTCSLWWHDNTVSAGASGAIFGLYGVFLALLTTNILHESVKKSFLTSTAVFIVYNLLSGLKPGSGVDNAAHIGGLISGLIMGYAMVPSLKNEGQTRLKTITVLSMLMMTFGTCFFLSKTIPNDYGTYDIEMARFSELEEKALGVFNLPEDSDQALILKEITERGLPGWYENLGIVSAIEKLDLPLVLKTRNHHLKKYCELRIKHYELLCKALTENSDVYNHELDSSNQAIGKVIAELSE